MTASYAPGPDAQGPDDPIPLTAREQQDLIAIEDDLWATDPAYALRMTTTTTQPGWPHTGGAYAAAALLLLLVVAATLPPSARAVVGLVLTLVMLPWLILHALERDTSR